MFLFICFLRTFVWVCSRPLENNAGWEANVIVMTAGLTKLWGADALDDDPLGKTRASVNR